MSDSRRLIVVVWLNRLHSGVCHGLYSTTEPIGAISALTRGNLHATAVAKTAQSSKTRVMGVPWRGAGTAMRFRLCVPVALLQAAAIEVVCMQANMSRCLPAHTLQYIRNSSIELLLGTHAGCSGRPPPYNGTLMHDSAQTLTLTPTRT